MARINDPGGCNAVLVQEVEIVAFDETSQLDILNIITEETFEQIRSRRAGGGGFSIGPLSLSGEADFNDFQERRAQLFQREGYNTEQNIALERVRLATSPGAVNAWLACKLAFAMEGRAFQCAETHHDADSVSVAFRWSPQPGVGDGVVTNSTLLGARVASPSVPDGRVFADGHTFPVNAMIERFFIREAGQDFDMTVEINGAFTCPGLSLAPEPPPPPPPLFLPAGDERIVSTGLDETQLQFGPLNDSQFVIVQAEAHAFTSEMGAVDVRIFDGSTMCNQGFARGGQDIVARAECRIAVPAGTVKVFRAVSTRLNAEPRTIRLEVQF